MAQDGFVKLLFGSFFRWWWAFITGFVSVLSWMFAPTGIALSRVAVTTLAVIGLTLLFLCVSTVYQGWLLYRNRLTVPTVVGCQSSDSYGGEFVFLLEAATAIDRGKVAELRRFVDGVEVPIGLVEFVERNSKGQFQARPVWLSHGHLRDLRMRKFVVTELIVDPLVHFRTVLAARDSLLSEGA